MVNVGGIVSVGGPGGGSGSTSGIQSINSQIGPAISIVGVNGATITAGGNVIVVNLASLSGLIGTSIQSGVLGVNGITVQQFGGNFIIDGTALSGLITPSGGIGGINGQIGPHINIQGVNGITVSVPSTNNILIDGIALSGVGGSSSNSCYSTTFTNITVATITHSLGTTDIVVNIFDSFDDLILPDSVHIIDSNSITIRFNSPQSGKVTILSCGSGSASGVVGVNGINVHQVGGNFVVDGAPISGLPTNRFATSFSNVTSGVFTHNLGTLDVIVQIYDDQLPRRWLLPDEIVVDDINRVSVLFNRPQSGRVVII